VKPFTPAPIIANGKVIIGFGGDRVRRTRPHDGLQPCPRRQKLWSATAPRSDKDVCLTPDTTSTSGIRHRGKDIGISSYPGDEWQRGGGGGLGLVQLRSALQLLYYSDRQPRPGSPVLSLQCQDARGVQQRTQDNKMVDDQSLPARSTPAKRCGPTR